MWGLRKGGWEPTQQHTTTTQQTSQKTNNTHQHQTQHNTKMEWLGEERRRGRLKGVWGPLEGVASKGGS